MKLDELQSVAFSLLKRGKNVLVTGPGGCGKSSLVKFVVCDYLSNGKNVGVTSTTGHSAVLIGGCTLHSFLGIGLGDLSKDLLLHQIRINAKKLNVWTTVELLVIDEVSMLDSELFDKLNYLAKILRNNELPFGGIQLLLSGDFYQLPVVKSGRFVFEADSWNECVEDVVVLTSVKRQANSVFRNMLNRLRVGDGSPEDFAFLEQLGKKKESDLSIRPTKLFCLNSDVDAINSMELEKLDGPVYVYHLQVLKVCKQSPNFDASKLCNAPETLKLCVGAEVILLSNNDVKNGLVNGRRGTVVGFSNKQLPEVKFFDGVKKSIDFHKWEIKEEGKVVAAVFQIPLRLAYAITIHKSQGMTLESASIDLNGVFESGQAYVALSRVKSADNLIVRNASKQSFKVHPKAKQFYESL